LDRKNVRLQVSGKTNLSKVEIKKACNLSTSNFSGEVGTITITGAISDQTTIGVPADKLYVDGKANLLLKKAIGEVVVDEDAAGTKLELDKAAKVSTLTVDGKVALSGSGTISRLEANAGNITYTSSLTISKTVTASGVKAPTITTTSSSSSSSSSSASRTRSVNTVDEFEAAVANDAISTINVTDDITDEIDATRTGSRSFTINFGIHTMGDVSITASAVSAITLNDSGLEDAGATIANLTIDAENAHVVNDVQVTGTVTILAVSHSTLVQQDGAGVIEMFGAGTLECLGLYFGPDAPTPPPVFINTSEPVGLNGTFGSIGIQQPNAQVSFGASSQVDQLTVGSGAGGGTITTGVGAAIAQVLANANVEVGGSGHVGEVQVVTNDDITITGPASTIGSITNTGSGTVTSTGGITVQQKAVKPMVSFTSASSPSATDGQLNNTSTAMEYKLASDPDTAYVTCGDTDTTGLAPGVYVVRVKEALPVLASDTVEITVTAPVAPVFSINYQITTGEDGEGVEVKFTKPDLTGIEKFRIEFSKDGTNWEDRYYENPVDEDFFCPVEVISLDLDEDTTFSHIKVTSIAEEDSIYEDKEVVTASPFTFTVSTDAAPAFTVSKTATGVYDVTLTNGVDPDALYVFLITKDAGTPSEYRYTCVRQVEM
jgi:hypothetical protein